ncbi:unnamed protein product [Amoebophrya sp. A25]|nr:unnamed protein product [Amoebophrya sp. A25]|eukprot:GSA25T00002066001.1
MRRRRFLVLLRPEKQNRLQRGRNKGQKTGTAIKLNNEKSKLKKDRCPESRNFLCLQRDGLSKKIGQQHKEGKSDKYLLVLFGTRANFAMSEEPRLLQGSGRMITTNGNGMLPFVSRKYSVFEDDSDGDEADTDVGRRDYVVTEECNVFHYVRSAPARPSKLVPLYAHKGKKLKMVLPEGTLINSTRRRVFKGETYVDTGREDGEWVPEVELQPVQLVHGVWRFRVVFTKGVCRRYRPTMLKDLAEPGAASVLPMDAVVDVVTKFRHGPVTYLRVADACVGGRFGGWIFDRLLAKDGITPGETVCEPMEMN